jgi:hypothetical protein
VTIAFCAVLASMLWGAIRAIEQSNWGIAAFLLAVVLFGYWRVVRAIRRGSIS